MSKCIECKAEMKPLFNGEYCPNECDLPPEKRTKKKSVEATNEPMGKTFGQYILTSNGDTFVWDWDGQKWRRVSGASIFGYLTCGGTIDLAISNPYA